MSNMLNTQATKRKTPGNIRYVDDPTPQGGQPTAKRVKKTTDLNDHNYQNQDTPVSKAKRSHKKKKHVAPQDGSVAAYPAFNTTRPWLYRKQSLSEQNLFILYCRDNLTSGSIGPTSWENVATLFNEHFRDDLKNPLSYKTLSRRMSTARKEFLEANPEYPKRIQYPIPKFGEDEDDQNQEQQEQQEQDVEMEDEDQDSESTLDADDQEVFLDQPQVVQPQVTPPEHVDESLQVSTPPTDIINSPTTSLQPCPLGSYSPSSVFVSQISVVDRAKFHLRHRSSKTVAFASEDENETPYYPTQAIDTKLLLQISQTAFQHALKSPGYPIEVPEFATEHTIDAFIQLISPFRATNLPSHYLWAAQKPTSGVYDRFGAIEVEPIIWTVDSLLELHALALHMRVPFICDMVIDRLWWMYTEQAKYKAQCKGTFVVQNSQAGVVARLPHVPNMAAWSIAADDFETLHLARMVADDGKGEVDGPGLMFVADLVHALGGAVDEIWLSRASKGVKDVVLASRSRHWLIDTSPSRVDFCARYHHHSTPDDCYTSVTDPSPQELIQQLYTFHSKAELLHLSKGLLGSDPEKLANSTPGMLDAEMQILELELRLEVSKEALSRARETGEDKDEAVNVVGRLLGRE